MENNSPFTTIVPADPFLDRTGNPGNPLDEVDPHWGLARSNPNHPLNTH